MISDEGALKVHEALHKSEVGTVSIGGVVSKIQSKSVNNANIRFVDISGHRFIQQDPHTNNVWASRAKKGNKITWIMSHMDSDRNNWGRIVNGSIKKRCSALSDSKLENPDDTLSETSTERLSDSITTTTPTKSDNSTSTCTPPLTTTSKEKSKEVKKTPSGSITLAQWSISYEELLKGDVLGTGAFGSVVCGTWRGTDVAIKTLHSQDEKALEMFTKEAELLCKLRHPNIVQCLGACLTLPNCCIVMELLPQNLSKLIKQGPIARETFNKIVLGIAQGLNFLHRSNPVIIHRDLKPANILLDYGLQPRIADFGVSREKYGNTATMTRIGTPTYCAPEILNGEHYSAAVDVYSFGVLIYEMVNHKAPWKNDKLTPVQLMMRVAINKQRPPIPETCDKDIEQLIRCCWDHDALKRPTAENIIMMFKDPNGFSIQSFHSATSLKTQVIAMTQVVTPTLVLSTTTTASTLKSSIKKTTVTNDDTTDSKDKDDDKKGQKECKYDGECYRQNPQHFKEEAHPNRDAYEAYIKPKVQDKNKLSSKKISMIEAYKKMKGVSDRVHFQILEKYGWSQKEYQAGKKESSDSKSNSKKKKKRKRESTDS
jgi:serine/threonine protein kinase